jgi:hypothetical protein
MNVKGPNAGTQDFAKQARAELEALQASLRRKLLKLDRVTEDDALPASGLA